MKVVSKNANVIQLNQHLQDI